VHNLVVLILELPGVDWHVALHRSMARYCLCFEMGSEVSGDSSLDA
jgi:hypothetical protein